MLVGKWFQTCKYILDSQPSVSYPFAITILENINKMDIHHPFMNIYLFPIYSLFFLICPYIYATTSLIMLMSYALIQSYTPLFFSISLIKPYLFITFSLPFYSLSQDLIRYTIFIVPSHFSSFPFFYYILLSSLILLASDPIRL